MGRMAAEAGDLASVRCPVPEDNTAFLTLVERHYRQMYRLAVRITGNEQEAKDVVQESWLRAYRGFSQFEGRADLGTWLHRIVVNCALDLLRAGRSRPDRTRPEAMNLRVQAIATAAPDPERLAASAETARRIESALEALSPVERTAFTLRHFEGYSIDEIAQTLGLRSNNVKQHIFRGIRKLRVALEPQGSGQ